MKGSALNVMLGGVLLKFLHIGLLQCLLKSGIATWSIPSLPVSVVGNPSDDAINQKPQPWHILGTDNSDSLATFASGNSGQYAEVLHFCAFASLSYYFQYTLHVLQVACTLQVSWLKFGMHFLYLTSVWYVPCLSYHVWFDDPNYFSRLQAIKLCSFLQPPPS
jgi:hypothetical protein